MTTICIPLHPRGGKFKNNTELRYTLRSIAAHFQGDFRIVLVTSVKVPWASNVGYVHGDGLKSSLKAAADAFPDGFFWWYDDCCMLRDADAEWLKVTNACTKWSSARTSWARNLDRIRDRLVKEGHQAWDYSRPHGPYWFDKAMVDEGFADWPGMKGKFPWETWILSKRSWPRRHGVWKQYYGRFKGAPAASAAFLNYNDHGNTPELRAWLDARFASPSRFEVPVVESVEDRSKRMAVSFSLYGAAAKYAVGVIENIRLCKDLYPEAEVVVHVESGHYASRRIADEGARIVLHDPASGHAGMMWRFESGAERDRYDVVLFRDADSRVNARERAAVDEWLAGSSALHCMRDHPVHRRPIMGGMWGLRTHSFDMASALAGRAAGSRYGDDEGFLSDVVWPALKRDCVFHSSRPEDSDALFRRFPSHAAWKGFVGEPVNHLRMEKSGCRMVYLSPERYSQRRERFLSCLASRGGFLNHLDVEWWKATPSEKMFAPPSFRDVRKIAHWWAATCDHLRIMEESLVSGIPYLFLFEDDAVMEPDFEERFWRAWAALPPSWKAMRLGWHDFGDSVPIHPGVLHRAGKRGGLMIANFWNQAGLYRAYDHFWHRRKMIIDMAFEDLRQREPQDWYQPASPVVVKDPLASQQGTDC